MKVEHYLTVSLGDVTNWMNQTSGAFNYTGLVENMEMKAGSFYGMISYPDLYLLGMSYTNDGYSPS